MDKAYEDEIEQYWQKNDTMRKTLKVNAGKPTFFFLDGPPYATGAIHMGTALNKILKDYYLRYKRMKGFDVWAQPGYDTHGLPIENKVEKQLGFTNKGQIEEYGIEAFNAKCKQFVDQHIEIMNKQFYNLGVWMDWDNPYVTYHDSYIEGAWYTFKVAHEKDLLYKDVYSVHVCSHCETAVAYNEIEYHKVHDTSVYVKFKLKDTDEYLLIWTTTPWTLPSNAAIMVHPKFDYSLVQTEHGDLWIAKELVEVLMDKMDISYKVLKTVKGAELVGREYAACLDIPIQKGTQPRVVDSPRYVNLDAGTGLVHTAPGHGPEDFKVGKEHGLPVLNPLEMNGTYKEEAGKYSGMYARDANKVITEDLESTGHIIFKEGVNHDYPHCWRCNTPLLFLAVPQWFFRITAIKEELLKQNATANWTPDWAGKRFDNWLETLGDWPISRQRYWGIPLPIWECDKCDATKVVGSPDELPEKPKELHRPFVDEIKWACDCGGTMARIPDVLDVWFDAGVAPWASTGYPRNKEPFEKMWPVDFVLEGPDQTRGWWNALTICGVITKGRIPFKNIYQHAFVLAERGIKMSKSKGNIIPPEEVSDKYSIDFMRYYFLRNDPTEDFDFNWDKADELKRFFNLMDNTVNFYTLYCDLVPELPDNLTAEDRWIISRVNSAIVSLDHWSDQYTVYKGVLAIEDFFNNDLSRWYVKLIRERTWPSYKGEDKKAAFATMHYVLSRLSLALAPVIPYKAENWHLNILKNKGESVHMLAYPDAEKVDQNLEDQMVAAREIVEACNNLRQQERIKLRWPLRAVSITTDNEAVKKAVENLNDILVRMCNVKEVVLDKTIEGETLEVENFTLTLQTKMDAELLKEALGKDIVRQVQQMRKANKFSVEDVITLSLQCEDDPESLSQIEQFVSDKVNASNVVVGELVGDHRGEMDFQGRKVMIAFDKKVV